MMSSCVCACKGDKWVEAILWRAVVGVGVGLDSGRWEVIAPHSSIKSTGDSITPSRCPWSCEPARWWTFPLCISDCSRRRAPVNKKKKTSVMCQKKLKTMTWHLNVPNYILQCTVNTHKKVPVLCFVQLFYRLPWSFQTFTRTGPLKMGLTFNHCRLSEEPVWLSVANLLSSVIILCARRPPSVQLLSLNTNLNKKWQCFNESNHVLLTRNSVICTFRG